MFFCDKMYKDKYKTAIISGTLSGCITATLFQPLELVKTRLQQAAIKNTDDHRKPIDLIFKIYKNEGFKGYWNGLTPAIYRATPVVAMYFTSIEYLRSLPLFKSNKAHKQLLYSFFIGAIARSISDITTFPLSLVKTRYESNSYKYKSIRNALNSIIKEDGFMGLYKGMSSTLIRDINYSGIYFMLYSSLKQSSNDQYYSTFKIALCSLSSSIAASFLTQPPDVIRTHMQLEPVECKTYKQTMKKIYYQNGLRGFFTGFVPRSTRRILITVVSWTLFEKLQIKLS